MYLLCLEPNQWLPMSFRVNDRKTYKVLHYLATCSLCDLNSKALSHIPRLTSLVYTVPPGTVFP
jgi:hypothetical protein